MSTELHEVRPSVDVQNLQDFEPQLPLQSEVNSHSRDLGGVAMRIATGAILVDGARRFYNRFKRSQEGVNVLSADPDAETEEFPVIAEPPVASVGATAPLSPELRRGQIIVDDEIIDVDWYEAADSPSVATEALDDEAFDYEADVDMDFDEPADLEAKAAFAASLREVPTEDLLTEWALDSYAIEHNEYDETAVVPRGERMLAMVEELADRETQAALAAGHTPDRTLIYSYLSERMEAHKTYLLSQASLNAQVFEARFNLHQLYEQQAAMIETSPSTALQDLLQEFEQPMPETELVSDEQRSESDLFDALAESLARYNRNPYDDSHFDRARVPELCDQLFTRIMATDFGQLMGDQYVRRYIVDQAHLRAPYFEYLAKDE